MSTFRDPVGNFTFETVVAFLGALLVIPLLFRLIWGTIRTVLSLRFVRRLLVDSLVVGATTLLTREDILDKLFGQKGNPNSKGVIRDAFDR